MCFPQAQILSVYCEAMSTLPDQVQEMVRRKAPADCGVIHGSTPVISFGSFQTSRVATLGINPSKREFLTPSGQWLTGEKQRLTTLASIGATTTEDLTDEQVQKIVGASDLYFQNNPYHWFNDLDKILKGGFNASYFDGSACHLDLSQWATDPTWSSLTKAQQQLLLDDGVEHLQFQLTSRNISHVIVNGRAVWEEIKRTKTAEFNDVDKIYFGKNLTSATLRMGTSGNIKFLGWTVNIQSSYGANANEFIQRLCEWLTNNK
jgi:hypothetical protein